MLNASDIEAVLLKTLPGAPSAQLARLARVLCDVADGVSLKQALKGLAAADQGFSKVLDELEGCVITAGTTRFGFERSERGTRMKVGVAESEPDAATSEASGATRGAGHAISVSGSHNVTAWQIKDSVVIAGDFIYEHPLPIYPTRQEIGEALRRLEAMPTETLPPVSAPPPGSRVKFSRNPFFVGREEDLLRLARMLKGREAEEAGGVRTVALTGFVGVGKTQLAVEFVHRFGSYFSGGVFWLNFSKPEAVQAEVAACGGLGALNLSHDFHTRSLQDQSDTVKLVWAKPMPRLLIFDNCESEDLLQEWRPTDGECRVLLTSRRDNWPAILRVQRLPVDVLSAPDSVSLLTKYRPDFSPTEPALKEIAEQLGHLPLALHLAGSYMEVTGDQPVDYLGLLRAPPAVMHESLQRRYASVTGYESTLAHAFNLCYRLLDPANEIHGLALILLARAAHFAPGHFIPRRLLIETLKGEQRRGRARPKISGALRRINRVGLIQQHGTDLRMHLLMAEFINDVTDERLEAEALESVEKALAWAAVMPHDAGYGDTLFPLHPHLSNVLHEASRRALKQGNYDAAARKLLFISKYLLSWGGYQDSIELFEALVGQLSKPEDRIKVLIHLANIYGNRGEQDREVESLRRALDEAHAHRLRADEAVVLNHIGNQRFHAGQVREALESYERALSLASEFKEGERPREAKLRINKAKCHYDFGETALALAELDRALGFAAEIENPDITKELELLFYSNRGQCIFAQGEVGAAIEHTERALGIAELTGDTRSQIFCLNNLGDFCTAAGSYGRAREYLERALEKCREYVLPRMEGHILHTLAELLIDEGEYEEAIRQAQEGASTGRTTGSLHAVVYNESALARAHLFAGEVLAAGEVVRRALEGGPEIYRHYVSALAGLIELRRGEMKTAAKYFTRAGEQAAALIARDQKNSRAHYTRGLSSSGLVVCGSRRHLTEAADAYRRALALNGAAGVVMRQERLLRLILSLDEASRLTQVSRLFGVALRS